MGITQRLNEFIDETRARVAAMGGNPHPPSMLSRSTRRVTEESTRPTTPAELAIGVNGLSAGVRKLELKRQLLDSITPFVPSAFPTQPRDSITRHIREHTGNQSAVKDSLHRITATAVQPTT